MGCGHSAFDEMMENKEFAENVRQFQAMQFSVSEVKKLYSIFRCVDVDNSGSIALSELLAHIDLPRTSFTEKIFSIFDDDKSGEIDFKEFVMSLWNYCTLTKNTLDVFAFDLYDKDGSGELSAPEIARMTRDIYGKNESKTNFQAKSVINELKVIENSGRLLNLDQFSHFVKTHQGLLFPAFQMQSALRGKILGQGFWESHANKRIKFTNGKYLSVGQFIVAHHDHTKVSSVTNLGKGDSNIYHVHDEIHELVQAAGSRASRRKSVARSQNRSSFVAQAPLCPGGPNSTEPPSVLSIEKPQSLTESAKSRLVESIQAMTGAFATTRNSAVSPAPAHVLGKTGALINTPALTHTNSLTTVSAGPTRHSSVAVVSSKSKILSPIGSPFISPRDNMLSGGSSIYNNIHHPNSKESSKNEASRRSSKEDQGLYSTAVVGGAAKSKVTPLTANAVGKIAEFSPIDAWQKHQPHATGGSTPAGAGACTGAFTGAGTVGSTLNDDAKKRRKSIAQGSGKGQGLSQGQHLPGAGALFSDSPSVATFSSTKGAPSAPRAKNRRSSFG